MFWEGETRLGDKKWKFDFEWNFWYNKYRKMIKEEVRKFGNTKIYIPNKQTLLRVEDK